MKDFLKYAGSFVTGYVGALIPVIAAGRIPNQSELISALAGGLLGTGLFHMTSPKDSTKV